MTRTSCVAHIPGTRLSIIREDYIMMLAPDDNCPDVACCSAILNVYEQWTNTKIANAEQSQKQNDIAQAGGEPRVQDESLWIYLSQKELQESLFSIWGMNKIGNCLSFLIEIELLETRQNPIHKWDRTLQYRFNFERVNSMLLKVADFNSKASTPPHIKPQSPDAKATIPKNASKSTSKNASAQTPDGVPNGVAVSDDTALANDATHVNTDSNGSISVKERDADVSRDTDVKQEPKAVKDSPSAPPGKPETEHQRRIRVLGEVIGIPPVPGDYGLYAKVYKHLLKCGLEEPEWPAYVAWVRWKANNGNWDFSVKALQTGGRVSAYLAEVEARTPPPPAPEPEPEPALTPEQEAALQAERERVMKKWEHVPERRTERV